MAQTPYTSVSWTREPIKADKLQQMANNEQWLFENTPKMRYTANGLTKSGGLKVVAGKTWYNSDNKSWTTGTTIYFGDFFSVGCKPVVTITINPTSGNHAIYGATGAVDNPLAEPDHRGFSCYIVIGTNRMPNDRMYSGGGWVHFMAVGY